MSVHAFVSDSGLALSSFRPSANRHQTEYRIKFPSEIICFATNS